MAADARQAPALFDPSAFRAFRFVSRELDEHGIRTLRYARDEQIEFVEELALPIPFAELSERERARVDGLLALLHWVAGVSYFKAALPEHVSCEAGAPRPAAVARLEALYSEGLGELAYVNGLPGLPHPRFAAGPASTQQDPGSSEEREGAGGVQAPIERVLVPVGGGKDSAVALEIVRRSGCELALF